MYRRYRPETFAEMIGQSQVTEPLMTALRTNRVNHAYLFSGPRGCGKTTSARILARCLNCAEGPTDTPCGVCPSCVELARDGGGSLDVVEIDAASHNGVDDARDIRERAIFAPARDRYKIFILDEAHMVTPQGFNALLKIVEEPPEHVKFIFATTEPEKVIGTIRSRTHHYPFRLVPPAPMLDYVQQMCETEKMQVAPGVLPLVVRAGGGSPRDTLSLLDQLMAGSDGHTVEYERAVALLGYTSATLLDDAIDALGARDAGAAFDAADRVIQTGQDPRRFVEDLLERMRDLIVVAATSAAGAAAVLRGVPQDEIDRMAGQAAQFGPAELSRTADILNAALTEMSGATSPRLHLELMIARALIPATDDSTRGALARVERLERRIGVDGEAGAGAGAGAVAPVLPRAARPAAAAPVAPAAPVVAPAAPARADWPVAAAGAAPVADAPSRDRAEGDTPARAAASVVEATPPPVRTMPVGPVTFAQLQDSWPEILEAVRTAKVGAWLVAYTAHLIELRGDDILVLSFPSEADVASFKHSPAPGMGVSDFLRTAIVAVLGLKVKFIAREEPRPPQPPTPDAPPAPAAPAAPVDAADDDAVDDEPWATASVPAPAADSGASPADPVAVAAADPVAVAAAAPIAVADATGLADAASADAAAPAPVAPVATNGWTTVAIPGASTPTSVAPAPAPVAPAPAATPAPTPTVPVVAPSPVSRDDDSEPPFRDDEPPFNDVPPPFDDDVPPERDAPRSERAPAYGSAGPDSRPTQPPVPAAVTAVSTAPAASAPTRPGKAAQARSTPGPSFAEKQRYGEAVVREILGATFIEEQPYFAAAPRPRGD
nr:DNA polymerase III subunit gamma and tau [Cryobacterium roopkundense]